MRSRDDKEQAAEQKAEMAREKGADMEYDIQDEEALAQASPTPSAASATHEDH